jgi:hypothetical protein
MLRVLIGTGALLMLVGFGAAGWQYWRGMPASAPAAEIEAAALQQDWLISATGGLVLPETVRAYLVQDRPVPERLLRLTLSGRLTELLDEGETLPDPAYIPVLADIRAPRLAEPLCAQILQAMAADCAVVLARVLPDSIDPTAGTATFVLELAYRERVGAGELPDLAAHVLNEAVVTLEPEPGTPGAENASEALDALLASARANCPSDGEQAATCRLLDLSLDLRSGEPTVLSARVAWLGPLPEGVVPAPPILPAAGG